MHYDSHTLTQGHVLALPILAHNVTFVNCKAEEARRTQEAENLIALLEREELELIERLKKVIEQLKTHRDSDCMFISYHVILRILFANLV